MLLHHLGLEDEVVVAVDWWELDRTLEPDHLTSCTSLPSSREAPHPPAGRWPGWSALMDTLRERCPWDSVQTHASLMPHLVEESYEVLDALADLAERPMAPTPTPYAHLQEELGDLLFQIVFHARLADEAGQFDLADVARRRARQARAPAPARVRRRRCRHGRAGRHELGGDQEEREGPHAASPRASRRASPR